MKKYFLIVLITLFAVNIKAEEFSSNNQIAIVKRIVNNVKIKNSSNSQIEIAKVGISLSDGGQVITSAKSLATIVLTKDKSLLTVRENSILNIYQRKEGKGFNTSTNIEKGELTFKVEKQKAEDAFEFITPSAVASIRGTSGVINVDSNETNILLEEGELFVQSKSDPLKNVILNGGNKILIDNEGNINVTKLDENDKKKIEEAKKTNTKKIYIVTPYGTFEIEYLTE